MAVCEICSAPLDDAGQCADCPETLRERFRAWTGAAFPFTAQPPSGAVDARLLGRLRRALLKAEWSEAEAIWTGILPGLRPIGAMGRAQLAEALEALAVLKEHLGKSEEARRLRQRAETARKDPSSLRFKQTKDQGHRWDEHAWLKAKALEEGPDPSREARIAAVEKELEAQLKAQEARQRGLSIGAFGFAGAVASPFVGLPIGLGSALGLGLGWAWSRRS
jgi:hypothetical protein